MYDGHDPRHVILVADRFAHLAENEQVVTVSEMIALASTPGGEWVLQVGQGVERPDLDVVIASCRVVGGSRVRLADPGSAYDQPVPPATVHKSRAENVLLANLRASSRLLCSADLRIHRDNEFVLDHNTGRHVQGMVVVEAMRQICIAQFEASYRSDPPSCEYAGLWHRMNITFESFLFALRAEVHSEITEARPGRKANARFRATASIQQNGEFVALADMDYSMVKREHIDMLEGRKAAAATRAQLLGHHIA